MKEKKKRNIPGNEMIKEHERKECKKEGKRGTKQDKDEIMCESVGGRNLSGVERG